MGDGVDFEIWRRSEPVEITIRTKPDSFGRQAFTASWLDNNIGPHCNEQGRRGQNFNAAVAEHVAGWEAHGYQVVVTDEWAERLAPAPPQALEVTA